MTINNYCNSAPNPSEITHQSPSNLKRVLLTVKSNNEIYGVGLIGIKHSPAELFYHSSWPKNAKRDLQDTQSGEMTKRPDHFSWHTDGNAHMRTSKKGFLGKPGYFPDHSFIPKDPTIITPLLIHSIKVNESLYDLPLLDEISKDSYNLIQQVAVLDKPQNFSVSLFLVPADVLTSDVLAGMWVDYHLKDQPILRVDFRNLCADGFYPGRFAIEGWSGCDVLFVLSDLIMPVPSDIEPKDYFKIITPVTSMRCFENLLAQRIGKVEFIKNVKQEL